ncbi:ornithine-oxo-acid transaminase [Phakopsora pachyrhizi]|uniref:Ornithine aminotransferase n=1 Tax=Phakopsora pachyrhizi TaxID=170000 RepID=A0AAV0BGC9_PHAPC|nr:ornithine-oxo-acid transaminase [Phakopsora pachyrhizi]
MSQSNSSLSSLEFIELEKKYGAHNYHPLPIVIDRASGCTVWDPEGNSYIDCLSAYSAVNQGHCHPSILKALVEQASRLSLASRAFHTSSLGPYVKKLTNTFGYEKALPMNTGVEAVETALKLARKWAYVKKGVPSGKAIIISAEGNFHGRTLGAIGMSTDPDARGGFGPFLESIGPVCPIKSEKESRLVRYNNVADLERVLEAHGKNTAAVLLEPIQGEAGVMVPDDEYLKKVKQLCEAHNVLLILDEVQTGLSRTGKFLCQHHFGVRADITTLGKALSGGLYPVSAVLADNHIMEVIKPGEHGSTFGGNPLACAIATAALDVLIDEKMSERAEEMGNLLRSGLEELKSIGPTPDSKKGYIQIVRGKGLLNAIVIDPTLSSKKRGAWELCLLMKSKGVLAKPTHSNIIRLAPPLIITPEEVKKVVKTIEESLKELDQAEEIFEE